MLDKIAADTAASLFGKLLVESVPANAIGVSFYFHLQARVAENDAGNLGKFFTRPRAQGLLSGIEQHVGHVHNQAAGRIACLENQIELAKQLRA